MRKVGEVTLTSIPDQRRSRAGISLYKSWCRVTCGKCGKEYFAKYANVKRFSNGKGVMTCKDCGISGNDEMKKAITELALRKAAMKKGAKK